LPNCGRTVRRILLASTCVALLAGCSQSERPVSIRIASDKILEVSDFKVENEDYGCTVSGIIKFDIAVDPPNFTGSVIASEGVLQYGKWRDEQLAATPFFVDGKQMGKGISVYRFVNDSAPKAEREAICSLKSSSEIKLVSLGKAEIALKGLKAIVSNPK